MARYPRSRRTMWDIVRELVTDGLTIFLTTQYLEEADQLADRIAVLDQGKLVAEGTPGELKRQISGSHVRLRFADALRLDAAARILPGFTPDAESLALRVPSDGSNAVVARLLETTGHGGPAGLRCARNPVRAFVQDLRGQTLNDATVEGDMVQLDVNGNDLVQLRVEFG